MCWSKKTSGEAALLESKAGRVKQALKKVQSYSSSPVSLLDISFVPLIGSLLEA